MSLIQRFCLHKHLEQACENRLKCFQPYFCTPRQFGALKTKGFRKRLFSRRLQAMVNYRQSMLMRQIDNRTLQNRHFRLVFAHFFACEVCRFNTVKFQTQHVMFANITCCVGRRSTLNLQIRRFKAPFCPLFNVCKNSKKKAHPPV